MSACLQLSCQLLRLGCPCIPLTPLSQLSQLSQPQPVQSAGRQLSSFPWSREQADELEGGGEGEGRGRGYGYGAPGGGEGQQRAGQQRAGQLCWARS